MTRDLAAVLPRTKLAGAIPTEEIIARVRDTANWGGGGGNRYQVASLPPGSPVPGTMAYAADDPQFAGTLNTLATTNFKTKGSVVAQLTELRHPNTQPVLRALLDGALYCRKTDKQVVIGKPSDEG